MSQIMYNYPAMLRDLSETSLYHQRSAKNWQVLYPKSNIGQAVSVITKNRFNRHTNSMVFMCAIIYNISDRTLAKDWSIIRSRSECLVS